MSLVGETQLTIALAEISWESHLPPEAQAKAIALSLAKAGIAKLR